MVLHAPGDVLYAQSLPGSEYDTPNSSMFFVAKGIVELTVAPRPSEPDSPEEEPSDLLSDAAPEPLHVKTVSRGGNFGSTGAILYQPTRTSAVVVRVCVRLCNIYSSICMRAINLHAYKFVL